MRPLTMLVVLCLTPAADACFLKCFRNGGAAQSPAVSGYRTTDVPVRIRAVNIYQINGKPADSNPEVPVAPNTPITVHCNFNPINIVPMHSLNGATGNGVALQALDIQHIPASVSTDEYWQFTYRYLPNLAINTTYTLRITVDNVTSNPPRTFHTPTGK